MTAARARNNLGQSVVPPKLSGAPTVDEMRIRLGGRARTVARAGELVSFVEAGETRIGVIVASAGDCVDVWIVPADLRRIPPADLHHCEGPPGRDLQAVVMSLKIFASLWEGQRVLIASRYGGSITATVRHKCRYGAIVVRDDGVVMGAGFRALFPAGGAAC